MWFVRWILTFVLAAVLIAFAMQNSQVAVTVRFWHWETVNDVPLWVVMYVSFFAGIFVWAAVSLFQILGLKAANRRQARRIRALENELKHLRNAAVEDVLSPESLEEEKLKRAESGLHE